MKKVLFLGLAIILISSMILTGCTAKTATVTSTATTTATKTSTATAITTATTTATKTATSTVTTVKEKRLLKFSYPLPDFDAMVQSAIQWSKDFNEKAGGSYEIKVYAGGVLGQAVEVFDMVRTGGIEMCDASPDFLSAKDLRFAPQGLPFVTKDPQATVNFFNLMQDAMWRKLMAEKYNVYQLNAMRTSPHDWNGTKPIYKLEDWKGKVVWVGGPIEAATVEALGGSATTLDWNDGYPAIEKGVVDGSIYGLFPPWMLGWEKCKYFTEAEAFNSSAGVVINLDVFNNMPPEIQELLKQGAKEHQDRVNQYFIDILPTLEKDLTAKGSEIYKLSADERARWQEATKSIADDYFAKLDPTDAQIIKDVIAKANQ